jgi:hypothetical protein
VTVKVSRYARGSTSGTWFVLHTGYTHFRSIPTVDPGPKTRAPIGQLVNAIEKLLQGGLDAPKRSGGSNGV